MKKHIYLLIVGLLANGVFAQSQPAEHEWTATVKVTDEDTNPIANAHVGVGYFSGGASSLDGTTDTNGVFIASHRNVPGVLAYLISFRVEKDGYYSTWKQIDLGPGYNPTKWNQAVTLVLRKVGKPIAMYAKQNLQMVFPEYNKAIGYDLTVGDWVGPYGKGINTDLYFTETHTSPQSGYIISVSFPNSGDGIQEFTVPDDEKNSGLRSAHEAPADGYQPTASQTQTTNPNRNFYFRVHTKLDENGNVVSARYGKIYGDLAQFTYYYNPTPNDRNVEFDPKQNLLSTRFKVQAP